MLVALLIEWKKSSSKMRWLYTLELNCALSFAGGRQLKKYDASMFKADGESWLSLARVTSGVITCKLND